MVLDIDILCLILSFQIFGLDNTYLIVHIQHEIFYDF